MTEIEFLADIAYSAYMEALGVKDFPSFKYTPKVVQNGWVAATKAVLDNAHADCTHHIKDDEEDIHPIFDCIHDPPPLSEEEINIPKNPEEAAILSGKAMLKMFDCVHDSPPFVHSDNSTPSDGAIIRGLYK